jgi:hypothetical protein
LQSVEHITKLHECFYGNQGRTEGELSTLRRTEHPGRQRTNRTVRKLVRNVFPTSLFLTPANTQRPTEERMPTVVDRYGLDKMMGIMWLIRIKIIITI